MRILITGATSGIGKQLALDYHSEGHEVWALGRNEKVLEELRSIGMHVRRVDLSDRQESITWFSTLESLDVAILNAGTCEYIDMPDFDSELVARVMRANIESMAISIEGVLPLLKKGRRPLLAGVGSSAAYLHLPRAEAYGASKAAIAYMIDTLRVTLSPYNIDVSLICPGFVKTPLTDLNDFPMPCLISVEQASQYIRKGIANRTKEIHFPRRFTLLMKMLSIIPRGLWLMLAKRMIKR